jgi:hypothetical protein
VAGGVSELLGESGGGGAELAEQTVSRGGLEAERGRGG